MTAKKPRKLTPELLKSIVEQEVRKFRANVSEGDFGDMEDTEDRADDAEETDADELAGALEKHIDYVKALKIEESRLVKRLNYVRERKGRALKNITKKI